MSPIMAFLHFICLIGKLSTARFQFPGTLVPKAVFKSVIWNVDTLSPRNTVARDLLNSDHESLLNSSCLRWHDFDPEPLQLTYSRRTKLWCSKLVHKELLYSLQLQSWKAAFTSPRPWRLWTSAGLTPAYERAIRSELWDGGQGMWWGCGRGHLTLSCSFSLANVWTCTKPGRSGEDIARECRSCGSLFPRLLPPPGLSACCRWCSLGGK